ncbi:MAG: CBS domain-containing protein, partial [Pseudomonadota bacterium]
LIGIASRRDSNLMRQCDVQLVLPPAPEACEQGIVPTTSTAMTLAIGDALAIAMMEHREFTPENFREFHPGGKLGARLSKVRDLMHRDLPLVSPETSMSDALLVMTQKSYGVLGVHKDGQLLGIITDGDLRRNMSGLLEMRAADVMTANPTTIGPDQLAEAALNLMSGRITCLFVVDPEGSNAVVGILHIHDCLRAGIA